MNLDIIKEVLNDNEIGILTHKKENWYAVNANLEFELFNDNMINHQRKFWYAIRKLIKFYEKNDMDFDFSNISFMNVNYSVMIKENEVVKMRENQGIESTFWEENEERQFSRNVIFNNCKFIGIADFNNVKFMGSMDFTECKFNGVASFNELLEVKEKCDFSGSEFNEVYFENTVFNKEFLFSNISIGNMAEFLKCTFNQQADFTKINFKTFKFSSIATNNIDFSDSTFYQCVFIGSTFEKDFTFKSTVANATFSSLSKGIVVFKGNANFQGSTFGDPGKSQDFITLFQGAKFFGNANFQEVKFKISVDFQNIEVRGDFLMGAESVIKKYSNERSKLSPTSTHSKSSNIGFNQNWDLTNHRVLTKHLYKITTIDRNISFTKSEFYKTFDLSLITVGGDLYSKKTTFKGKCYINNCKFNSNVDFENSTWESQLYSTNTRFATTERLTTFTNCKFYNSVIFNIVDFNNITFSGSSFYSINITNCYFYEDVNFSICGFLNQSSFHSTTFEKNVYFEDTAAVSIKFIDSNFEDMAVFDFIKVLKNLTFERCNFKELSVYGSKIGKFILKYSSITKDFTLNMSKFDGMLNISHRKEILLERLWEIFKKYLKTEIEEVIKNATIELKNDKTASCLIYQNKLSGKTDFSFSKIALLNLRNTTFGNPYSFLDVYKSHQMKILDGKLIKEEKKLETKNIYERETARMIKDTFDKQNNIIEGNYWYAIEMEKYLEEIEKNKGRERFTDKEWWVLSIHKFVSSHASNWIKPLLLLITLGFFTSAVSIFSQTTISNPTIFFPLLIGLSVFLTIFSSDIICKISIFFIILLVSIVFAVVSKADYGLALDTAVKIMNPFSNPNVNEIGWVLSIIIISKIIMAFLAYQFIISMRQNIRRK